MATQKQFYVKLARQLPPRLIKLFQRYPPVPALGKRQAPSADASGIAPGSAISDGPNPEPQPRTNPFQPQRHPITGRWHNPVYSLRQQADLVKLARQHGVEELLPFTIKGTQERLRRRQEGGLRVKGTGVGQRVKGKMWERALKGKLEKRRQAMLEMPNLIEEWKRRGHGRGWKKWPR